MTENTAHPLGVTCLTIKLTDWLTKTLDDDVIIERQQSDGVWVADRFMRTCTVATGIQELNTYKQNHELQAIRLQTPFDGLEIHHPTMVIVWE